MAAVRYATYADILSRINGPPAFHSVSNGAVSVDCPKAKTVGSEKAAEVPSADECAVLQSVQEIIERMLQRLDAWISAPVFPPLPLPVESPIDEAASVPANLLSPDVAPTSLLQSNLLSHSQTHQPPPFRQPRGSIQPPALAPTTAPMVISQPNTTLSTPNTTPSTPKSHTCSEHPPTSTPQPIPPTMAQPLLPEIIATHKKQQVHQPPIFMASPKRAAHSMVGNEAYIASAGHSSAVDWWSVRTPIYDVPSGYTPFREKTRNMTVAKLSQSRVQHWFLRDCRGILLLCSFSQVRKHEYEPPPDNTTCLGFNPSLEDKAVSTAVQLICIDYLELVEWQLPNHGK